MNGSIKIKIYDGKIDADFFEKIIACNADAYEDYPLITGLLGKDKVKKRLPDLWRGILFALKKDVVFAYSGNDVIGSSIWKAPTYKDDKILAFLLNGGLKLDINNLVKMLAYNNYCNKIRKKYTDNKTWYLYDLTIKKQFQNKGIGSSIIKKMFEYIDNAPVYLETHKDINVEYYKKFGFELVEVSCVPIININHYAMLKK